jgi:hypothetical protein
MLVSLSIRHIYTNLHFTLNHIDSTTLCFRTVSKYNPYLSFPPVNYYLFSPVCRCIMQRQILYQIGYASLIGYYLDIKMSVNLKHKITAIDHTTLITTVSISFCRNRTLYPFSSCSKLCSVVDDLEISVE